jgi:hypothetical protein
MVASGRQKILGLPLNPRLALETRKWDVDGTDDASHNMRNPVGEALITQLAKEHMR